jgi:hypothetical protein
LEELRSLSEETWRTISQELWAKAPSTVPSFRLSEVLALFARSGPFRVPFFVAGSAFLFLLVYVRVFEPLAAAVMTVSWLGGIVPLSLVFNSVLRPVGHLPKSMFVLMATFFIASSVRVVAVASMLGLGTQWIAQVISVHALTMALMIGCAVFPTVARAWQGILDNLHQRSFDQATLEKLHVESQLDMWRPKNWRAGSTEMSGETFWHRF